MNKYKQFQSFFDKTKKFYGINDSTTFPDIIEVKTRTEFNKILGRNTEKWEVGFVKEGKIVIFYKDIFEKVSTHKNKEWEQILRHELCHILYMHKFKTIFPLWLNEGLACILAEQHKPKIKVNIQDALNLTTIQQFRSDKNAYQKSYWLVKKLLGESEYL